VKLLSPPSLSKKLPPTAVTSSPSVNEKMRLVPVLLKRCPEVQNSPPVPVVIAVLYPLPERFNGSLMLPLKLVKFVEKLPTEMAADVTRLI
jgi:hypothetical protein